MRLSKLNKAWFPIPDDPDGTKFEIKILRSGELKKVTAATQKQRFEIRQVGIDEKTKKPKYEPVQIVDLDPIDAKEMEILESICDWENFFDSARALLPYSDVNKVRLSKELSEDDYAIFLKFASDSLKELKKQVAEEKESALGN